MNSQKASRLIPKNVFASINEDNQRELIDLKLPSSIRINPQRYDPKTYQVEDPIKFKNDKGQDQEKICAVDNIIRWRYADKEHPSELTTADNLLDSQIGVSQPKDQLKKKIESNAKIVRWSDDTYSLAIGDELFDIQIEQVSKAYCFSEFENFFLLKDKISQKMTVKPSLNSGMHHKKIIKRITDLNKQVIATNITQVQGGGVIGGYKESSNNNSNSKKNSILSKRQRNPLIKQNEQDFNQKGRSKKESAKKKLESEEEEEDDDSGEEEEEEDGSYNEGDDASDDEESIRQQKSFKRQKSEMEEKKTQLGNQQQNQQNQQMKNEEYQRSRNESEEENMYESVDQIKNKQASIKAQNSFQKEEALKISQQKESDSSSGSNSEGSSESDSSGEDEKRQV